MADYNPNTSTLILILSWNVSRLLHKQYVLQLETDDRKWRQADALISDSGACENGLLCVCCVDVAIVCHHLPSPLKMTTDRAEKLLSFVFTRWRRCEWSVACVCVCYSDGVWPSA